MHSNVGLFLVDPSGSVTFCKHGDFNSIDLSDPAINFPVVGLCIDEDVSGAVTAVGSSDRATVAGAEMGGVSYAQDVSPFSIMLNWLTVCAN